MKKNKFRGLTIAWIGVLILILNTIGYYTKLNFGNTVISIIGMVLTILGIKILKTK